MNHTHLTTDQRLKLYNKLRFQAKELVTKVVSEGEATMLYVVRPITEEEKNIILATKTIFNIPNGIPLKVFNYRSYNPDLLRKIIPQNINGYGFIADPGKDDSKYSQRRFPYALDPCVDGHYGNVHIPFQPTSHYQWKSIFTSLDAQDKILLLYKIPKDEYLTKQR